MGKQTRGKMRYSMMKGDDKGIDKGKAAKVKHNYLRATGQEKRRHE